MMGKNPFQAGLVMVVLAISLVACESDPPNHDNGGVIPNGFGEDVVTAPEDTGSGFNPPPPEDTTQADPEDTTTPGDDIQEISDVVDDPDVEEQIIIPDVEVPDGVEPLSVEIILPGEILSDVAEIEAKVTGGGTISGVEFYVDWQKVDVEFVWPFSTYVDTKAFSNDIHTITVETADSFKQFATASVDVIFDNAPPLFQDPVPAPCTTLFYEDGALTTGVDVFDASPLAEVNIHVNGAAVSDLPFNEPFTSPFTGPFYVDLVYADLFIEEADLPKTLFVQFDATDVQGQTSTASMDLEVHRRLAFSFETLQEIWATPVVLDNGNAVFGNQSGELFALTPSGDQAWSTQVSAGVYEEIVGDPNNGNFYVGTTDFNVYSFNQDGGQNWVTALNGPVGGGVAVASNTYYVASYTGTLYSLCEGNDCINWSVALPDKINSTPVALDSGRVYVGCDDGNLYAFEGGTELWSFATADEVRSSPVVDGNGVVYFASNDGYAYAVNDNGEKKWEFDLEGDIEGRPLLVEEENAIYFASNTHYITKLNRETGELLWTTKTSYIDLSSPVRGPDGTVYIGTASAKDGRVYALNAETGDIMFIYYVGDAIHGTVALSSDRIYFGSTDRNFYSIWMNGVSLFGTECDSFVETE